MTTPTQQIEIHLPFEDFRQFQRFVVSLTKENRYHLPPESDRFVSALVRYAERQKTIKFAAGESFWRARAHDFSPDQPFSLEQMGAPPRDKAGHGRLNPRGIPYLYLASDELTAISEVRPWKQLNLTVAEFQASRELRIVNITRQERFAQPTPPDLTGAEFTWSQIITWLFSHPFDPRDDTAYVPTQYIAERVKAAGFDGIAYDSALHTGGYNVALFDTSAAKAISRKVAKVTDISVEATMKDLPHVPSTP